MSKIDEMLKNEKVEWKKLGEVCEISTGKLNANAKDDNGKYPFFTTAQEISCINEYAFDGESLLVAGNANIGDVKYYKGKFNAYQRVYVLQSFNDVNAKFLMHYMKANLKNYLETKKKQSAMTYIVLRDLENFEIPIPSLKIQEKIAKTLDKFTNYVTELQSELQLRNKQYEYYRDKLLSKEYLNKVLNNYDLYKYELRETTLGDLAQVNRGASPRPISNFITNSEDGVPWIKISDAGLNSKYINQTIQRITREGAKKSRLLKKGDFIISNSMSYGRPYILAIEGCIHDGWASISEYEENLNSDFLYHYLNSNKVQNYWLKKMNTSSVSNLNSDIIKSLPIPLIDKNLQAKIAEILDKFQAITQDINGSLPDEIEKREKQYEYYREKLLTFDTERTRGGYQVLSSDYISLLTQAGAFVGVNIFELEEKSLGEIAKVTKLAGYEFTKYVNYKEDGNIIALRGLNVKKGKIVLNDVKYIDGSDLSKLTRSKLMKDDILFTYVGTIGEVGLVDLNDKYYLAPNVAMIRITENDIISKYLIYLFQTNSFKHKQINKWLEASSMKNLTMENIRKFKILIPPLPIQEYIVSMLDEFEALSQSTTEGLRREIELREKQYEYYREKLLTFEK